MIMVMVLVARVMKMVMGPAVDWKMMVVEEWQVAEIVAVAAVVAAQKE
jgi:hypothetical protein